MPKTPTLQCDGLFKQFGDVRALADVSVRLSRPGIVAIIGPNGAGKTTLLNAFSGFVQADRGVCRLEGLELSGHSVAEVARLGIARTFQEVRVIDRLSAIENVMLARPGQRGESLLLALASLGWRTEERVNHAVAERALESVGLGQESNRLALELSYGQRKLLSLAVVQATEARVLLLDEPIAGIHPERRVSILNLLRRLRDDGKLLVLVEHDMPAVREVADTVILMDEGRVVAEGEPSDILQRRELVEAYLD